VCKEIFVMVGVVCTLSLCVRRLPSPCALVCVRVDQTNRRGREGREGSEGPESSRRERGQQTAGVREQEHLLSLFLSFSFCLTFSPYR